MKIRTCIKLAALVAEANLVRAAALVVTGIDALTRPAYGGVVGRARDAAELRRELR